MTVNTFFRDIRAKVEASNARFAALSLPQQCQVMALDALDALNAKAMEASPGNYVVIKLEGSSLENANSRADFQDMELRDVVAEVPRCEVCLRGGLFISAIMRNDEFKANWLHLGRIESDRHPDMPYLYSSGCDFESYESDYWEPGDIALMEAIFEKWSLTDHLDYLGISYTDKSRLTSEWLLTEFEPDDRFRIIAMNIIVSGGRFNPFNTPSMVFNTPMFAEAEAKVRALLGE